MEVLNKTLGPLAVPLPGGKKLRLGPRQSGRIADKAATHPPLAALVEKGDIELIDVKGRRGGGGGAGGAAGGGGAGPGRATEGGVRHTGDR